MRREGWTKVVVRRFGGGWLCRAFVPVVVVVDEKMRGFWRNDENSWA